VRSLLWEVHVGIRGMVATETNEKEGTCEEAIREVLVFHWN
jgi:hypothetical protein